MTMIGERRSGAAWVWCCLVLAGCGGGDGGGLGVGGSDRSGDGNGALRVEARIEATPAAGEDEHAASTAELSTRFHVDVRDAAGADVPGATVVIESELGPVQLEEGGCERRYCGVQSGYARTYEVGVRTAGPDFLDGVRITGPRLHDLDAPEAGAFVVASMPLLVRWSPSGEADATRFETREIDLALTGDSGEQTIPAGTLRTRDDGEPEDERIRIERSNTLVLTGGLPGSDARVSVRNGIEIFSTP